MVITTGDSDPAKGSTNTSSNSEKTSVPSYSGTDVLAPSGNFVSSHSISLSDPRFLKLESVCTTSPGATCGIVFKKDGITKTLETKTANSNGAVTWYWSPQEAGLSVGSWQIIATAQIGNSTKSSTDLQSLEVSK